MKTALERIKELKPNQIAFTDFNDTLVSDETGEPNMPLINALLDAQQRGVRIVLWTHAPFKETVDRVEYMRELGLEFTQVYSSIPKGDLIIDNLAVAPPPFTAEQHVSTNITTSEWNIGYGCEPPYSIEQTEDIKQDKREHVSPIFDVVPY